VTTHEHDEHAESPLSDLERRILKSFHDLNVPAGSGVPTDVISSRMVRLGSLLAGQPWQVESALVSLQVRGLIQPGEDPFSAIAWELTPGGHEFVHSADFASGKSP
jgi:hypothetical protein